MVHPLTNNNIETYTINLKGRPKSQNIHLVKPPVSIMTDEQATKPRGVLRVFSFKFSYMDLRLATGTGVFAGLLAAKIWTPILDFEWYWYMIAMFALMMKPLMSFFSQFYSS